MPKADERVTVTLPHDMVDDIDRRERNRSRFIREAVARELDRRKREELRASLGAPHAESMEMEALGVDAWFDAAPEEADPLLDPDAGLTARWSAGEGWSFGKAR